MEKNTLKPTTYGTLANKFREIGLDIYETQKSVTEMIPRLATLHGHIEQDDYVTTMKNLNDVSFSVQAFLDDTALIDEIKDSLTEAKIKLPFEKYTTENHMEILVITDKLTSLDLLAAQLGTGTTSSVALAVQLLSEAHISMVTHMTGGKS